MSAHDKNELDLVVSQAEESVVKNLGLGIEKHPTNKKHSKKKITKWVYAVRTNRGTYGS